MGVQSFRVLATAAGQISFREALGDAADELGQALADSLARIESEGPLCRLGEFSDSVRMHPDVNVGLPTLRCHTLETAFVARLVEMGSISEVSNLYRIERALVERAVEFEQRVAA